MQREKLLKEWCVSFVGYPVCDNDSQNTNRQNTVGNRKDARLVFAPKHSIH